MNIDKDLVVFPHVILLKQHNLNSYAYLSLQSKLFKMSRINDLNNAWNKFKEKYEIIEISCLHLPQHYSAVKMLNIYLPLLVVKANFHQNRVENL